MCHKHEGKQRNKVVGTSEQLGMYLPPVAPLRVALALPAAVAVAVAVAVVVVAVAIDLAAP